MRRIQVVHWVCPGLSSTSRRSQKRLASLEHALAKRTTARAENPWETELVLIFARSAAEDEELRAARMVGEDTVEIRIDD
jgi:hypothetical protein